MNNIYLDKFKKRIDKIPKLDKTFISLCNDILFNIYASLKGINEFKLSEKDLDDIYKNSSLIYKIDKKHILKDIKKLNRREFNNMMERNNMLNKVSRFNNLDNFNLPEITNNGGILYGSPGNGKSYDMNRIKEVFKECGHFEITSSMIQAKGFGSSIKLIDDLVISAKVDLFLLKFPYTIIIFDEMEIIRQRSGLDTTQAYDGGSSTTSHLLKYIGLDSTQYLVGAFWLGATNLYKNIDDAIKRTGRMGYKYMYKKPSREKIEIILSEYFKYMEKVYNLQIDKLFIKNISIMSVGVIDMSSIKLIARTLLPDDSRFSFLDNKKRKKTIINYNDKWADIFNKKISILADNDYSKIKNSKMFYNLKINRYDNKYLKSIFTDDDNTFYNMLKTMGKISINIIGKPRIGKTTLAFLIINYITSCKDYEEFDFNDFWYTSYSTFATLSTPYENSNTISHDFVIMDEMQEKWPKNMYTDTYILIRIIQKPDISSSIPRIEINDDIINTINIKEI